MPSPDKTGKDITIENDTIILTSSKKTRRCLMGPLIPEG